MIAWLAKVIAHSFVVNHIVEESKEKIYAYGMELLISDVLNTVIIVCIASVFHMILETIIFMGMFIVLRYFVGGFHAKTHLTCMLTLVAVMVMFCLVVKFMPIDYIKPIGIVGLILSLTIIVCLAPVTHPNKPISAERKQHLRKLGLSVTTICVAVLLPGLYTPIQLYMFYGVCGVMLSAIMAVLGRFSNKGGVKVGTKIKTDRKSLWMIACLALVRVVLYFSVGNVCCITFYQPKEPDMHDLFERRD